MKNLFVKAVRLISAALVASTLVACSSDSSLEDTPGDDTSSGPNITVVGDNPMSIDTGTQYIDPGATAVDSSGSSVVVTSSGTVDTSLPGDYTITYTATDSAGNETTTERIVRITGRHHRVEVSFFGDGAITSLGAEILCEERFCTAEVEDGNSLTLVAEATAPWTFSRWKGCDVVNVVECTITPTEDVLLDAAFDSPNPLTFRSNVIGLTEDQIRSIVDFNPETGLLTLAPGTDTAGFNPGTIIVSTGIYRGPGDPENIDIFFSRRVKRVIALTNAVVFIDTAPTTLSDIIESGTLVIDSSMLVLDPTRLPPGITARSEVASTYKGGSENSGQAARLSDDEGSDVIENVNITALELDLVLYDLDRNYDTRFDQIRAVGTVDLDLDADARFDWPFRELTMGPRELRFIQSVTWSTDVALEVGGEVSLSDSRVRVGPPIPLQPIYIPPYVVIFPRLQLYFGHDIRLEMELQANLAADLEWEGGVQYLRSAGWRLFGDFEGGGLGADVDWDALTEPTGGRRLVAEAGPELALEWLFYQAAGPHISVQGYGGFEAWESTECERLFEYQTYVGGSGNFGGLISVLGWQVAYEAELFDTKWYLDSSGCESDGVPEDPINLSATIDPATNAVRLTWEYAALDDGYSFRVFRDYREVERDLLESTFVDHTVQPDTDYCFHVVAVNQYGTSSELSDVACISTPSVGGGAGLSGPTDLVANAESSTAISLSWAESSASGVSRYVIYDASSGQPYAVSSAGASPTTLLNLLPDTQYCFEVTALSRSGIESASSNVACATTLGADAANWTVYLACQGREYLIEERMDLDIQFTDAVSIVGEGNDYDGTLLAYALTGVYRADTQLLSGDIIWTFEGSTQRRRDLFEASLEGGDSGDVYMEQVEVTGCDAMIRFLEGTPESAALKLDHAELHSPIQSDEEARGTGTFGQLQ